MIRTQNQIQIETNSSTMSDLVFLLLIFFMITSTLISPNAVKLLLPESSSKTMAKQNVTVYIDDTYSFFVGEQPASVDMLEPMLEAEIGEVQDACVVLRADKTVPVQYVVNVIDAVNAINGKYDTKHKVILATSPKP
jgi:biopolymer transport protein ExbD